MKLNKFFSVAVIAMMAFSCKQEIIELKQPSTTPVTPTTPSKGNADFTKFIAIGNSLAAGFQAGALFNEGQTNSFPAMMAEQFALVGGGDFNQPTINSVNGYSGTAGPYTLGRYILFDPDGSGPRSAAPYPAGYPGGSVTCPSAVTTPALPAPYNTADAIGAFTGTKSTLNNFGVPGIQLIQVLTPATGGPPASNPAYNPYYARFASSPSPDGSSGSSILTDAISAAPTFFLLEIGNNDVLGYATTGGNGSIPITPATGGGPYAFDTNYGTLVGALLASNSNLKGVLATIPNVTNIPYFFTVKYNAIPLDQTTADLLMSAPNFGGYNQILDLISSNPALLTNFSLSASDLQARKVTFTASTSNKILIADKDLADLGSVLDYLKSQGYITDAQRTALTPYQKVRQAGATDLITLPAGGVLGTCVGNNPLYINGVSIPLDDKYALTQNETGNILAATLAYNNTIKGIVAANPTRLALADVNKAFADLVTAQIEGSNGVFISPTLAPPTGAFSEDGVHPNTRGYAFLANIYLSAINTTFSANIPLVDISKYSGTGLPVNP